MRTGIGGKRNEERETRIGRGGKEEKEREKRRKT